MNSSSSSVSESLKNKPVHLKQHIVPLDFKAVLKLPDSHTWTLPDDDHPTPDPFTHHEAVPVVDLANPQVMTLVRQACEEWGVFLVTNHGIPIKLLNQIELQTERLFELPADQKILAVRSPEELTGYGLPRISNFFSKLMWVEGFTIMGSPLHNARQLLPHDHISFCDAMEEYQKELNGLAEKVLRLMFGSLGLAQEDLKWFKPKNGCKSPQAVLQLNSYPVCPDPSRAMGLAPHTDSSLLTLLHQSNASGLQVLRENVGWVPVHPISGALVVIVGDLMQIMCNGRFNSPLHRVLVNKTRHRISTAYFYGPPKDTKVKPSVKLIDNDHPILYRPVTWREYLDAKATHFNKALEFIRYDVSSPK